MHAPAQENRRLRLLQLTALTSTCDRFAIAPLLVVIGLDLGAPLVAVAAVASGYFLAYGLMQPVWGMVSDRIGRVRVMRLALLGAALAGIGSALAPNLLVLQLTRAAAGGCFAALQPTTLVYVGDVWPAETRQRPLSDVLAASSFGIAVATAGAGLLADLVGWRVVPAVTAVGATGLWVALRRLPEPDLAVGRRNPLRSIATVLRHGWALAILVIVFVEGVVVLGVLTYLAPAVSALGFSAAVAGLAAAAFGAGAMVWSRVVRPLVGRLPPARIATVGGTLLVVGWAVPSLAVTLGTVVAAGLLLGGAWAFLHSTLQNWATQVVPAERATAVALFAASLFLGSSAGAALAAPLAGSGDFTTAFRLALAVSVPLAVAAAVARARYGRTA
ncbi:MULTISPECIES: MFS transporter [unclassified Pseudonocardia]|uniref:MFS transporter n=1 Tax=unclassified Pseudonocardia TaxID=2619320 RepID=UPI00095EF8F4|nr:MULTISPECIES: MFS transporter [unclassified Pseudonocardia]MBN9097656.1 MFS transporter [Pseudonocardia sp.]OJY40059.1 MAG: MFS transporter [Pseudonocardia sp. 73-21]